MYNDFSQPGQMCRDVGVIYIWGTNARIPGGRRTRIAYNWIHDNLGAAGACPLVYLDNYCRDFVVDHNVIWNSNADAGIRLNRPASGHRLYNNTLFNCDDLGSHTHNMWPENNPDPAFWTGNHYDFLSANNLFLDSAPHRHLRKWRQLDFRLVPSSSAAGSGRPVPGYTECNSGGLNRGAYETANSRWTAGVGGTGLASSAKSLDGVPVLPTIGFLPPQLNVKRTANNCVTITAAPTAAAFQLWCSTNLNASTMWFPVTNAPTVSSSEWSLTLPVMPGSSAWFRLQSKP